MVILTGDALVQALQTPPDCPIRLWRLGGAGIALQTDGHLLLIDPFIAPAGGIGWVRREPSPLDRLPPADGVLLTHEHDDHADPLALSQIAAIGSCRVFGPAPAAAIAEQAGVPPSRVIRLAAGDQVQVNAFTITALPVVDADSQSPLAYVVEVRALGWCLYHGGDAQPATAFRQTGMQHRIDCACLSAAGVHDGIQYYLTPPQAVEAAGALGARTLIPMHWDLWTINGLPVHAWEDVIIPAGLCLNLVQPGEAWCPPVEGVFAWG
ncbi:MAG: MBL fold metallo-hydrolase [bacterium]|nr:MBL fold metallo-hydrolase [bacterium]